MNKDILNARKEKIVEGINNGIERKIEVLDPASLMIKNKERCNIIKKGAKRLKMSAEGTILSEGNVVFNPSIFDDDSMRIRTVLYEIYDLAKQGVVDLKTIKKAIKISLRKNDYENAALIDEVLNSIAEQVYELNEIKDDAFWNKKTPKETFTYENKELLDITSKGIKVLKMKNNKKA